jgi:hypothetical protein
MAVKLQKGLTLCRHPATRFACHHQGKSLTLFVNGESRFFPETTALLEGLNTELQCAPGRDLDLKKFQRHEACLHLLSELYNQGFLVNGG